MSNGKNKKKTAFDTKKWKTISSPLLKVLLEGVYDEDCILSKLQARNPLQVEGHKSITNLC